MSTQTHIVIRTQPLLSHTTIFSPVGSGKFSTQHRDAGVGFIKPEPYVKTSGMRLGPYYDWKDSQAAISAGTGGSWLKRAATLTPHAQPRPGEPPSCTADIIVKDIDCPIKCTMATFAKFSPVKYSSAFSATRRGVQLRPETSELLGPGAYPGAYKTLSQDAQGGQFSKRERGIGEKIEQTDTREIGSGFRSFGEDNSEGITFLKAGNPGMGRTEKQVRKIYPRLGAQLYEKHVTIDLRNMKDMPQD